MLAEVSDYFKHYEEEKYLLGNKRQEIKENQRDLINQNFDNKIVRDIPPGLTSQDKLFVSELSLSLREVRFGGQEFSIGKLVSNIKYYHLRYQNNNLFHLFNDQLDYVLAKYFVDFETTKGNVDKFLSNTLMAPLIKNLSY